MAQNPQALIDAVDAALTAVYTAETDITLPQYRRLRAIKARFTQFLTDSVKSPVPNEPKGD